MRKRYSAKWEQISRQPSVITPAWWRSIRCAAGSCASTALPDTGDAPYLLGQAERRIVRPTGSGGVSGPCGAEVPADCLEDIQKAARDAESS